MFIVCAHCSALELKLKKHNAAEYAVNLTTKKNKNNFVFLSYNNQIKQGNLALQSTSFFILFLVN